MPDADTSGARGGWGAVVVSAPACVALATSPIERSVRPRTLPAGLFAVLCAAVVAIFATAFAGSAAAAPRGASVVRLEDSITPALSARARSAGTTVAGGRRLHLTVTLKPRDPAALVAYASAVATPG